MGTIGAPDFIDAWSGDAAALQRIIDFADAHPLDFTSVKRTVPGPCLASSAISRSSVSGGSAGKTGAAPAMSSAAQARRASA